MTEIKDGLETLRGAINWREAVYLIEQTALWAAPETFKKLPVWYPEYARGIPLYKKSSEPQNNTNRTTGITSQKFEANVYASKALKKALGIKNIPNWACCHIWSIDDIKNQLSNFIVRDRRFYSCIGNMILLPSPLKAFTDHIPDIKMMLRICSYNLYGWRCDHESLVDAHKALDEWRDWDIYPKSWPREPNEKLPVGLIKLDNKILKSIETRKNEIRHDLANSAIHYPRDEVLKALDYWQIQL